MFAIPLSQRNAYTCLVSHSWITHQNYPVCRNRPFKQVNWINVPQFEVSGVGCQFVNWGYVVQGICSSPYSGHSSEISPNAIRSRGLQALCQSIPLDTVRALTDRLFLKAHCQEYI